MYTLQCLGLERLIWIDKQSLSHLPGFEAFATPLHNNIFQDTIKIKITQSLGEIRLSILGRVSWC
jgi:hypothetical protein